MPRVYTKTKSARGKEYKCGRCGTVIQPGTRYHEWAFRYGGTQRRCANHYPRQSELTQSKMSEVYAAVEAAEDALPNCSTVEEVQEAVHEAAEGIRAVADEYREAAEAMGAAGYENEEKADGLEGWADDLENWEAELDEEEEFDEDEVGKALAMELFGIDDPADLDHESVDPDQKADWLAALQGKRDEWDAEHEEKSAERLEDARGQANEKLGECPI